MYAIMCICREWCTICVCKHRLMPQIGVLHQKCQNSQNHSHMLCCIIDVFALDAGAAPPPSPPTSIASNHSQTSAATPNLTTQGKAPAQLSPLLLHIHVQQMYGCQGPSWLHCTPLLSLSLFRFIIFKACLK